MSKNSENGLRHTVDADVCADDPRVITDFDRHMTGIFGIAKLHTGYSNGGRIRKYPLTHRVIPQLENSSHSDEGFVGRADAYVKIGDALIARLQSKASVLRGLNREFYGHLVFFVGAAVRKFRRVSEGKAIDEGSLVDAMEVISAVNLLLKMKGEARKYFMCIIIGGLAMRVELQKKEVEVQGFQKHKASISRRGLNKTARANLKLEAVLDLVVRDRVKKGIAFRAWDVFEELISRSGKSDSFIRKWLNQGRVAKSLRSFGAESLLKTRRRPK